MYPLDVTLNDRVTSLAICALQTKIYIVQKPNVFEKIHNYVYRIPEYGYRINTIVIFGICTIIAENNK